MRAIIGTAVLCLGVAATSFSILDYFLAPEPTVRVRYRALSHGQQAARMPVPVKPAYRLMSLDVTGNAIRAIPAIVSAPIANLAEGTPGPNHVAAFGHFAEGNKTDALAAISKEDICITIVASAQAYGLPVSFFSNLIWQESRFDLHAVSPAGAKGIAQFMPETAADLRLDNPFDPLEAIPASAQLLRQLVTRFGNLGLAAAAYNAGPQRVTDWLEKRRTMPGETRSYVRIVTGKPAEHWRPGKSQSDTFTLASRLPCRQVTKFMESVEVKDEQPEPAVDKVQRKTNKKAKKAQTPASNDRLLKLAKTAPIMTEVSAKKSKIHSRKKRVNENKKIVREPGAAKPKHAVKRAKMYKAVHTADAMR